MNTKRNSVQIKNNNINNINSNHNNTLTLLNPCAHKTVPAGQHDVANINVNSTAHIQPDPTQISWVAVELSDSHLQR